MKHCDDYIDDESQPAALRAFLARARQPAHGMLDPEPFPKLFATRKGVRVRVTMASRFGHVGVTTNFSADAGYENMCGVHELAEFGTEP